MVAFSAVSTFQVRLPVGNNPDSLMNLVVYIRDQLDCVIKYDMLPVKVLSDQTGVYDFIGNYHRSDNYFMQLIQNGNQNTIRQVITILSQEFSKMNHENVKNVILGEY